MEIPEEANTLVQEGILHDYDVKHCKILNSECKMTQYFKCYQYGHIAVTCWRLQTCGISTKGHPKAACETANDSCTYIYSNCQGKHNTRDKAWPVKKAETNRAAAAYTTQLVLFKPLETLLPQTWQRLLCSPLPPLLLPSLPNRANSIPSSVRYRSGHGRQQSHMEEEGQTIALRLFYKR